MNVGKHCLYIYYKLLIASQTFFIHLVASLADDLWLHCPDDWVTDGVEPENSHSVGWYEVTSWPHP